MPAFLSGTAQENANTPPSFGPMGIVQPRQERQGHPAVSHTQVFGSRADLTHAFQTQRCTQGQIAVLLLVSI